MSDHPQLLHTVIDAVDAREVAEFWRELLGLVYRPGDEAPAPGEADDADWLVLTRPDGARVLAVQQTQRVPRSTWPDPAVPQQLHLDLTVDSVPALAEQRDRALRLGAAQVLDRTDDPEEPLYVLTDPAGHPFCLFVA